MRQERYFLYAALIIFTIVAFSTALYFIIKHTQNITNPSQPEILFGNDYISGTSEYSSRNAIKTVKTFLSYNNLRLTYSSQSRKRPSSHRPSKLGCPGRYSRSIPFKTPNTLRFDYPHRSPVNTLLGYVQMLNQNANNPRCGRSRAELTRHPQ